MSFVQNSKTMLRNLIVGTTLTIATSTAFAHVSLISATPAANTTVSTQPKNLSLNFADEVMLMKIQVLDEQRRELPLNYKVSHDLKKTFDIAIPTLKKGKYTVLWSTMGKDGHNMNGEYSFSFK
ncbi:copper resistance CopC family protein [Acinetobacter higginsii]|uniref:copper resistance CopC family protein n=1 Tax=Acinetobacter higginsii TaxID=70347 RepID=UPI001F4B0DC3|nr:copper resistance CopC family protein [Acinetobacter higginsii]MCH7295622.1 copper resistance protein CopC [Acinetobacter higginsii]MCH7338572.1 copper resistance protein CopC [Acinetobacter higginsii]MCI3877503.1 copper resistance protein CopC [Acinetobacter higginsii]